MTIDVRNRTLTATAQVWQLTSLNSITWLGDVSPAGSSALITVPPQSITLVVFPPAGTARRRAVNR